MLLHFDHPSCQTHKNLSHSPPLKNPKCPRTRPLDFQIFFKTKDSSVITCHPLQTAHSFGYNPHSCCLFVLAPHFISYRITNWKHSISSSARNYLLIHSKGIFLCFPQHSLSFSFSCGPILLINIGELVFQMPFCCLSTSFLYKLELLQTKLCFVILNLMHPLPSL